MPKIIVYFSRAGENYVSGALKTLAVGNTQVAAEILREITGADIFRIEPVQPYSDSYNECIEQAKQDNQNNARPALKALPDSFDGYDTIYLGYPNYWGTMPMCVFTFLEKFDFSGKTIKPFCTHEGSGLGTSESDIKKLCPGARVEKGLAIHGSRMNGARAQLEKWA
ncbi:MAG: flavodoxin [Oscillospiraceae bacterium]